MARVPLTSQQSLTQNAKPIPFVMFKSRYRSNAMKPIVSPFGNFSYFAFFSGSSCVLQDRDEHFCLILQLKRCEQRCITLIPSEDILL